MKFPLVFRSTLDRIKADLERIKESLGSARSECVTKAEEIKGVYAHLDREEKILASCREDLAANAETITAQKAEIENLTAAIEKLRGEYNELGKMVPAFRPKAVRWSGPDGVRAKIERAIVAQAQERTAVIATNSETRGQ